MHGRAARSEHDEGRRDDNKCSPWGNGAPHLGVQLHRMEPTAATARGEFFALAPLFAPETLAYIPPAFIR
jgi:hypothetical protein